VPRPKLFVSKTVLGSSPDEEVLCISKTKHKRRTVPRQNLFVSARRLQELRSQPRKLSLVRVSVKILGLGIIFSIIFNDTWPMGWHATWHIRTHDESPDDRRCDADTSCHLLRRWQYECHKTRRRQTDAEHDDAYCRDADKRLHICTVDEPRDALRHDIIEPTLSAATHTVVKPKSIQNQAKRTIETPYKTLTNRRRASRRRQMIPYIAYMSLVKTQDKTLENRCSTSQRRLKVPYKAYLSPGKPQDKTLAKRRRALERLSSQSRLKIHDHRTP
jgi:hypothetical protein